MNRIVVPFLTMLAAGAGCYTWHHAPGHATRGEMPKLQLRLATGAWCISGICDKHGPRGRMQFSDIDFLTVNNRRTRTRFTLDYDGVRARCQQFADPETPFACTVRSPTEPPYRIALERGCMLGTVRSPAGPAWTIQTDTMEIAWHVGPEREVSLLDADGVVAYSDARNSDFLEVHARPNLTLSSTQLVILAALHAFVQIDGAVDCGG